MSTGVTRTLRDRFCGAREHMKVHARHLGTVFLNLVLLSDHVPSSKKAVIEVTKGAVTATVHLKDKETTVWLLDSSVKLRLLHINRVGAFIEVNGLEGPVASIGVGKKAQVDGLILKLVSTSKYEI